MKFWKSLFAKDLINAASFFNLDSLTSANSKSLSLKQFRPPPSVSDVAIFRLSPCHTPKSEKLFDENKQVFDANSLIYRLLYKKLFNDKNVIHCKNSNHSSWKVYVKKIKIVSKMFFFFNFFSIISSMNFFWEKNVQWIVYGAQIGW